MHKAAHKAVIVTNSPATARAVYPDRRVVSSIGGVLDLKGGTRVIVYLMKAAGLRDDPVVLAHKLIGRGVLREVAG